MRSKVFILLISVFMIGLGSTMMFFEVGGFSYYDEYTFKDVNYKTVTNTYSLTDIDIIAISNEATIVIDDTQEGIKVDLTYISDIMDVKGAYNIYTYDCTDQTNSSVCTDNQNKKELFIMYNILNQRFNLASVTNLFITQLKDKTIVNLEKLFKPKITVTLSTVNSRLIKY